MTLKKALLIVDVQNDFCPGGALAVPEGDRVVPVLNQYIRLFKQKGLPLIASRDWHPKRTNHFKPYGGQWPEHCVQHTEGARFHPHLMLPPNMTIVSKGMDPVKDSYSVFKAFDFNEVPFLSVLKILRVDELYIGGLATDYCVQTTVLDALKYGLKVNLLIDAIRGVNNRPQDSETAVQRMVNGGAHKVTLKKCHALLMSGTPENCDHIALFSKRAKRLAQFYVEKLGFVREKEGCVSKSLIKTVFGVNTDCLMIRLATGNVKLELFQPVSLQFRRRVNATTGYHHWGYHVGDRGKYVRKLKRKGIPIIEAEWNGRPIYFLKDPDGNRIEIRGEI